MNARRGAHARNGTRLSVPWRSRRIRSCRPAMSAERQIWRVTACCMLTKGSGGHMQAPVPWAIHPLGFLVSVQREVNGVAPLRVRNELISAFVELEHQRPIFGGAVDKRWVHARAAVDEKLDEIRRDPFIVKSRARRLQLVEQLGRQMVRHRDGTDGRASTDGQFASIAQHSVQLDLVEAAGGIHDARNPKLIEVMHGIAEQRELLIQAERAQHRAIRDLLSRSIVRARARWRDQISMAGGRAPRAPLRNRTGCLSP